MWGFTAQPNPSQDSDQFVIDLHSVLKKFPVGGGEITVLKAVSLQVGPGEFVAVVGPSGSGKSTLLNMITGIDRPSAGEVYVLGEPLHKLSENGLARWRGRNVGIIFQFFQLLPALSLLKNVILPMDLARQYAPRERRARALHLLDLVGLADQANKLPSMVSGGQQQRAAIVRALANDPPLLVADEPTGNLDTATAHLMFDLFHQFVAEGKTMVVVTHDKELALEVPRRVEFADGHIIADGSTHALTGGAPAGVPVPVAPTTVGAAVMPGGNGQHPLYTPAGMAGDD